MSTQRKLAAQEKWIPQEMTDRGRLAAWWFTFSHNLPWQVMHFLARLLYGFEVIGEENFPTEGPFILNLNEYGIVATLLDGWVTTVLQKRMLKDMPPDLLQSFMMEELWSFGWFSAIPKRGRAAVMPLMPQGAGRLALGLLEGIDVLRRGGMVTMNAEGDGPWDGRPLVPGKAQAWMALHTGAPIVPALVSVGHYDIGPMWRAVPRLRGKTTLNIGKPFTVTDKPLMVVTPEDIKAANKRMFDEFNKVRFYPETMEDWAGPPTRNGERVSEDIELKPAHAPVIPWPDADHDHEKMFRRGVAQLLWRCPMCETEGSILHKYRLLGGEGKVRCRACGTHWKLKRIFGHDFRMIVKRGHPDMVGLDMALTEWFDRASIAFEPKPIEVSYIDLRPGEVVFLAVDNVKFSAYKPSPLFDGMASGEAPASVQRGGRDYADHHVLGEGRVLITSERLIWQGPEAEVYFEYPLFTAANMFMTTLIIRYGPAPYRFNMGQQVPLRIMNYLGPLLKRAADADGHELQIMRFRGPPVI
jgi:1-acyl-sn-glycerol-3-phosphate acyltransferase